VRTTDFSTPCFASRLKHQTGLISAQLLHVLLACLAALFVSYPAYAQNTTDVNNVRLEQAPDGMYLSATMRFELPSAVEDALLKGIAITFVAEAQVLRDRWYWYDKSIATATRNVRLSYQPLTRRWRISVLGNDESTSGASLSQSFDKLPDAIAVVRRISRWKIAEGTEIDQESRHNVDFRFRLDTTQLPRPMQIGITGNADWNISLQRNFRPDAR
jgi:Domain of unknown function (DUF4390)